MGACVKTGYEGRIRAVINDDSGWNVPSASGECLGTHSYSYNVRPRGSRPAPKPAPRKRWFHWLRDLKIGPFIIGRQVIPSEQKE